MSLINDALKRVKEAQRQAPPSAELGPQLRPVEDQPPPVHTVGLLLPVGLVALSLLALLLVWVLARKDNASDMLTVRADGAAHTSPAAQLPPQTIARPAQTASAAIGTKDESAKPLSAAEPAGTNATLAAPVAKGSAGLSVSADISTNSVAAKNIAADSSSKDQTTNSAPTAEPELPKPPPLKLQGIVFSKRPSAVINGKTFFVGDRLREFRVVAITPETAILTSGGRTNVLSFSE